MKKIDKKISDVSDDKAVREMLKSLDLDISTIFERSDFLKPCPIGMGISSICCKNCSMGPCRIKDTKTGLCGATADTVAARNLARMIAAGAAAHSDHGRD